MKKHQITNMVITINISEIVIGLSDIVSQLNIYSQYPKQAIEKWVITVLKNNLHINLDFSTSLLIDFPLLQTINRIDPNLEMALISLVKLPHEVYNGVNSTFTSCSVGIRIGLGGTLLLDFKEG